MKGLLETGVLHGEPQYHHVEDICQARDMCDFSQAKGSQLVGVMITHNLACLNMV